MTRQAVRKEGPVAERRAYGAVFTFSIFSWARWLRLAVAPNEMDKESQARRSSVATGDTT